MTTEFLATALLFRMLLGHLVGDYLLQSRWMARTKSAHGWPGILASVLHAAIYTASVCLLLWRIDPVIFLAVGVPHWLIDRYSLADHWLRLIRGRTPESALALTEPHRSFAIAFYAFVYAVTDNTLHLLCLWALALWLAQ